MPIAKCATTYPCPDSGHSIVLVADQVLWFGTDLHCSLLNPHQIRSYGHSLCDDQCWDPHRSLGLDVGTLFIPLLTSGPNLFFNSTVTSDWELDNLPIVEITAPHWDPSELTMPCRPTNDYRAIDSLISFSETANVLSHISLSLDPRRLSSLYSSARRVSSAPTRTGIGIGIAATITGEQHSTLTPENLARKWNIGLEMAKQTIHVTTQRGIRTAIHPLHRRYRVDHLHLNRRRLNGKWFTDTLFSPVVSIQGNSCA